MKSTERIAVALATGILVGATLTVVTPAGADASRAAATSWKKVWAKKLRPMADKRYHTKEQADSRYATKSELGGSYTRAEADGRFATPPDLVRGTATVTGTATATNQFLMSDIAFGMTLPQAPQAHYIATGTPVPAGCSGTSNMPDAAPGHLCVFEHTYTLTEGQSYARAVCGNGCPGATRYGAVVRITSNITARIHVETRWAMRPHS